MNLAATALEDMAAVLASGESLDFEAAFGMARLASDDPVGVSKRTGMKLPDKASAEDFLLGEFLDRQSLIEADRAVRMTQADVNDADRSVSDAAFAYAGMDEGAVRKMQADGALGDNSASVRLAQKFYFG